MATHSSVLAWRIPGTGEPGELLSMGSHRVRHDWNDLAVAAFFMVQTSHPYMTTGKTIVLTIWTFVPKWCLALKKKKERKKTTYLFYLFGCAMQHMDSSSLTRDWTHTPCIGSSESQPLTCQGSVMSLVFNMLFRFVIAFLSRSNCLYKVAFLKNTKQNLLKILRLLKFLFLDKLYS